MVNSRRNNCFVIFQTYADADDDFPDVERWSTLFEAWVAIDPERGRETNAANETVPIVTHIIRGDFLDLERVTEKMRVIYSRKGVYDPIPNDAQVYMILAVMPDETNHQDVMIKAQLHGRPYGQLR